MKYGRLLPCLAMLVAVVANAQAKPGAQGSTRWNHDRCEVLGSSGKYMTLPYEDLMKNGCGTSDMKSQSLADQYKVFTAYQTYNNSLKGQPLDEKSPIFDWYSYEDANKKPVNVKFWRTKDVLNTFSDGYRAGVKFLAGSAIFLIEFPDAETDFSNCGTRFILACQCSSATACACGPDVRGNSALIALDEKTGSLHIGFEYRDEEGSLTWIEGFDFKRTSDLEKKNIIHFEKKHFSNCGEMAS